MKIPKVSLQQLVEVGAHFGHSNSAWNPKMKRYIFGQRNKVHIINLDYTLPLLRTALGQLMQCASEGGRILFVGTKRQAQEIIREMAVDCGQYYVNKRWLGGTLTNWPTITKSISQLIKIEEQIDNPHPTITKKEIVKLKRRKAKLDLALGGIRTMGVLPDMVFIVDIAKEALAVAEAKKLGIPIVGIVDSNSDPDFIDFPIPANDDAMRAINLYCSLAKDAILEGARAQMVRNAEEMQKAEQKAEEEQKERAAKKSKEAKASDKSESTAESKGKKPDAKESTDASKAESKGKKPDAKESTDASKAKAAPADAKESAGASKDVKSDATESPATVTALT